MITNLPFPPAPPDATIVLYHYFPSFTLPPLHQQPFIVVSLSMFATSPQSTLLVKSTNHMDIVCNCHTPAPAACLCNLCRVTASVTVSCKCASPPPFAGLSLLPCTCYPQGGFPSRVNPSPLYPHLSLHKFSS